ncbi:MAG: CHASE sensor domain-containing protein [Acidobacteriota bacterium]
MKGSPRVVFWGPETFDAGCPAATGVCSNRRNVLDGVSVGDDAMTYFARVGEWVRNLSLARKVIAVIMGVTSAALLIACLALVEYDRSTARTTMIRDIGMRADVVGVTSTAAVSFGDANGAKETLHAVSVNKNVRLAAIVRRGVVFARFDRQPDTVSTPIPTRVDPDLLRTPRAAFTFESDSADR